MKSKWIPITAAVTVALSSQGAFANDIVNGVDYYGYFRTGIWVGAEGNMKDSFGDATYQKRRLGRLGNEFDTYGEIGLGKELYSKGENEGKESVYIQTMFNVRDTDTDSTLNDSPFGWENLNVQFRNFFDMGETTWVGIRQYNKSSHVMGVIDYFYWNSTNIGAGVENMQIGQGKLSVAALHRDLTGPVNDASGVSYIEDIDSNQLEVTYADLRVWDGGTLGFGYKFLNADPTAEQIDEVGTGEHDYADGHAFMVELNQTVRETGFNRTVLQYYMDGSALQAVTYGGADSLNGTVKSGDGWALRNFGSIPLAADWDFAHVINYSAANDIERWDGKKGEGSALSATVNVAYHWSDITRTYVELGYYDEEKTVNGQDHDRSGSKYTIAQALSYGRGQPELRLFASYFDSENDNWNENNTPSSAFENGTSDDTWVVGVQANIWW